MSETQPSADIRALLNGVIEQVPIDFGGGSGLAKAETFAALIADHGLASYLEIGVYRGRSLFPVAALFRHRGRGIAVGIDPWSFVAAEQHDVELFPPEAAAGVAAWNRAMDWDALYAEVTMRAKALGVEEHVRLIRATSADASSLIGAGTVDVLHIDGNHDREAVLFDVRTYLPKVRPGGFVLFDDAWWPSVQEARALVATTGQEVKADRENDFIVYRLPG